jgi:hypothetical protein
MKTKFPGLLAVGLLAASLPAQSAIVSSYDFSVDTATELQGTFSLQGRDEDNAVYGDPLIFELFPTPNLQFLQARRDSSGMVFGTNGVGYPDDPYFDSADLPSSDSSQTFGPYSGYYTNGGQFAQGGTPVYWRYFNWQDTGGEDGTFSGAFCFSTSSTTCSTAPVPLPAAAWLLLSGLGGLGFIGRRKAA